MRSKKNPSILRKTSIENIANLTLAELDNELKDNKSYSILKTFTI